MRQLSFGNARGYNLGARVGQGDYGMARLWAPQPPIVYLVCNRCPSIEELMPLALRFTRHLSWLSVLALQGCFLFSSGVEPSELDLGATAVIESAFRQDLRSPHLYHSADGLSTLVGIRQCGEAPHAGSRARTRQLFVGFSGVKVEQQSQMSVEGVAVDRAQVSAELDAVPVRAITYSFASSACAFDLVLWSSQPRANPASSEGGVSDPFQASQQALEALFPQLIPALVR